MNKLEKLGFRFAIMRGFRSHRTTCMFPTKKAELIKVAEDEVMEVSKQYADGLITQGRALQQGHRHLGERDRKGRRRDDEGTRRRRWEGALRGGVAGESFFPIAIYMMADSGARGSTPRSGSWPLESVLWPSRPARLSKRPLQPISREDDTFAVLLYQPTALVKVLPIRR